MVENEISIGKTCLQCIKALKANEISIGKTFDLEMVNSKQSPFEADWSKILGLHCSWSSKNSMYHFFLVFKELKFI